MPGRIGPAASHGPSRLAFASASRTPRPDSMMCERTASPAERPGYRRTDDCECVAPDAEAETDPAAVRVDHAAITAGESDERQQVGRQIATVEMRLEGEEVGRAMRVSALSFANAAAPGPMRGNDHTGAKGLNPSIRLDLAELVPRTPESGGPRSRAGKLPRRSLPLVATGEGRCLAPERPPPRAGGSRLCIGATMDDP